MGKLLIVDDDPNLLDLLKMRLESEGHEVMATPREDEAIEAARDRIFDLSIIDLQLSRLDGISLMTELHLIQPEMPIIILTGYGSIESAVEAMRKGAFNYLTKPFEPDDLLLQVERALEKGRLVSEVKRLEGLLEERYGWDHIVARSEKMKRILEMVSQVARTDSTVYIHGESGTGKELIAKAIHLGSHRRNKPFVAINCAALPEPLLESRLFGHEKGAFTGAVRSSKGLFVQAHGGTLFLDEIGDMSLTIQAKLLRVLQERQFYPVGSETLVEVDVRVIVATNKDLEDQVKQGLFREDLFYRIHVIPISLPPLRERKEDIPPLVEHFIKKFNTQMKKTVKGLTAEGMQKLMLYDWPGNIRELENVIECAMALTQTDRISEDLLFPSKEKAILQDSLKPLKEAKEAFEKNYLIRLLQVCKGNVSQAAKIAGKFRPDLYDLLKKHGLKSEDFKR
ncbi:MAG: sigma-54 dependent transcriptional regulator [Treponemataceae bacterium]|nr:sigma-54 dependent transcriptional regulator [Treponemataceae bacterium]